MYFVYAIQNPAGILYKGHTNDLRKRLNQHNAHDGFKRYTANKGPWRLVYSEQYLTREEAKKREQFFKTGKGRKLLKEFIK